MTRRPTRGKGQPRKRQDTPPAPTPSPFPFPPSAELEKRIRDVSDPLAEAGVPLDDTVVEKLVAFVELLEKWSPRVNLVSRRELPAVVEKHLLPSITPLAAPGFRERADDPVNVLDIGSGGGFPGVVIGILRPSWKVGLVEARRRKALFLDDAARDLPNVTAHHARVEYMVEGGEHAGRYDLITARAVAPAAGVWPLVRSLLHPTGEVHVFVRRDAHDAEAAAVTSAYPDVHVLDPLEPSWHPGAVLRLQRQPA